MFCRAGNNYIPERKRSRPNFLFRERTFLFQDQTVQISEKKSPLSEKEVGPWPFPLGHILVSGPTEHLFCWLREPSRINVSMHYLSITSEILTTCCTDWPFA